MDSRKKIKSKIDQTNDKIVANLRLLLDQIKATVGHKLTLAPSPLNSLTKATQIIFIVSHFYPPYTYIT